MARIAVTGASGFVAGHLRRHLAESGIDVIPISRKNFTPIAGERKIVSPDYERGMIPGIRGADALVHLVGIGRQSARHRYGAINAEITKNMARMCKKAGVKRIVYLSGLGVSSDAQLEYFASKHDAEQAIKKSGLDYTILRPSYIVGYNDPLSLHLKRQIKGGAIEIPGSGRYSFQPVHVGDAVQVLLDSALKKPFRNKTLDLVGPEKITFERYVRLFAAGRARIKKTGLEEAYRAAMARRSGLGVDDLNIMIGSYEGNHARLAAVSKIKFRQVSALLKSGLLS